MDEYLESILKFVQQMKGGNRLCLVAQQMGFQVVETIVMRGVVKYCDVSESEYAK